MFDADAGTYKRRWGTYGERAMGHGPYSPGALPAQEFRGPVHCADVSNDGLVYVCDRTSNRLQIFRRNGEFVREVFIARDSRADGAVWDLAFSRGPQQRFLYKGLEPVTQWEQGTVWRSGQEHAARGESGP